MDWFKVLVAVSLAVLVGTLAALYSPAAAASRFQVNMFPPAGDQGDKAHLHCKYHGACGASSGGGLDWDSWTNVNNRDGQFRGYVFDLAGSGDLLRGDRTGNLVDGLGCDYMSVKILDSGLGVYKGTMTYVHTQTDLPGFSFWFYTGWSWWYASTMVGDSNCAAGWSGYHIHEKSSGHRQLNPDVKFNGGTYGDYCTPTANHTSSDDCLRPRNDNTLNWTRDFAW
ncbi:MAG: hypothetical protein HYS09_06460 [Chloroflexi bacterium]|nr:hypothetical protein [Chloroflexota bacterium]